MATLEQLEAGLIAADKAGNVDDATIIAAEIRKMRSNASLAASMDPVDLSIARSKNDAFGEYLRSQAQRVSPGEPAEARQKRLYGDITSPLDQFAQEHPVASKAATFLQGVPFAGEYLDEAVGKISNNPNATDLVRGMQSYTERISPKTALGLRTAGGITGAIPMAVAAAPAVAAAAPTSIGMQIGAGAVAGGTTAGIEGAVSGYGSGTDSENRKREALTRGMIGTGLGGLIGGAVPAVSAVARPGIKRIADALSFGKAAKRAGLTKTGHGILTRAMDADQSLSGPGAANIARSGDDAMLADAGPNARKLLDTAIQRSGKAGNIAREAIEARASGANKQIGTALDDALGAPQGIRSTARKIAAGSAKVREAAYNAAYSKPIDYAADVGRSIEDVVSRIPKRIFKDAVDEANDAMQAAGKRNMQILADIADDGTVTFREMPNVQQLDELKKALGSVASKEVDNFGRKTASGLRAGKLAKDLRDAIGDAVPEYKTAVKLGGDKIAEDNALRLGSTLLRPGTTREEVAEGVKGMLAVERKQAAAGIRASIDDTLANVKRAVTDGNMDAREAVRAVKDMSSRANREKVAMVIGRNKADAMFKELDRSAMALDLRAGVAANSQTFARESMNRMIREQSDGGIVAKAAEGEPFNATKGIVQALTGRTPAARLAKEDKFYEEIAHALTGPRGPDAARTLSVLSRISQQNPRNAALARRLASQGSLSLGLLGHQTGTQAALNRGR